MEKFHRGQLWVDSKMFAQRDDGSEVSLGGVFVGRIRIIDQIVEIEFDEPHPAYEAKSGTFPVQLCSILWGMGKKKKGQ